MLVKFHMDNQRVITSLVSVMRSSSNFSRGLRFDRVASCTKTYNYTSSKQDCYILTILFYKLLENMAYPETEALRILC